MLNDARIWKNLTDSRRLTLIAGPCVIESEKLCFKVATALTKTCAQLGIHRKPCGLLNIREYYRSLIDFLDHAVGEEFIKAVHRAMLLVEERPDRPTRVAIREYLGDRRMLLLIDNFEHVAAAAGEVGAVLASAPEVKALVTSRALLRVSGEHDFPVPPLGLPSLDGGPALDAVARGVQIRKV